MPPAANSSNTAKGRFDVSAKTSTSPVNVAAVTPGHGTTIKSARSRDGERSGDRPQAGAGQQQSQPRRANAKFVPGKDRHHRDVRHHQDVRRTANRIKLERNASWPRSGTRASNWPRPTAGGSDRSAGRQLEGRGEGQNLQQGSRERARDADDGDQHPGQGRSGHGTHSEQRH